jgi:hypothetical protein
MAASCRGVAARLGRRQNSGNRHKWAHVAISCGSLPSAGAGAPGTRCRRSLARTQQWCRAAGPPDALPTEQPPTSPTIPDRSWSAPTPDSKSGQDHGAPYETAGRCRWRRRAAPVGRRVAASALGLVREFSDRQRALDCIGRSGTLCANPHWCRAPVSPTRVRVANSPLSAT